MNKINPSERLEILIGKDKLEILKNKKIMIIGIGGVGSFAAEAIARSFVGNITIVDYDKIDITNINRQIHANHHTINNLKVDEMKKRILSINPNCNLKAYDIRLSADNISKLELETYDYVIDAIDDIEAKIMLIRYCLKNKIKIISSMGFANKISPEKICISKLKNTVSCRLAKRLRSEFKNCNLDVVYSKEHTIKTNSKILGSCSFVPPTAGLIIASFVIRKIICIKF